MLCRRNELAGEHEAYRENCVKSTNPSQGRPTYTPSIVSSLVVYKLIY